MPPVAGAVHQRPSSSAPLLPVLHNGRRDELAELITVSVAFSALGPVLPTTLALASLQVVVETGLCVGLAMAIGRVRRVLDAPRVRARLEAVSGSMLVLLGVRVAALFRG